MTEKVLDGPGMSLFGENTVVSGQSLHQRQLDNFLNVNSNNKFEKIHEGLLPGPLHGTWHAMKQTSTLSAKSHTEVKERSLPPSVGGVYCLNTSQELSFTRSSAQQMLEVHMKVSYEDAVRRSLPGA